MLGLRRLLGSSYLEFRVLVVEDDFSRERAISNQLKRPRITCCVGDHAGLKISSGASAVCCLEPLFAPLPSALPSCLTMDVDYDDEVAEEGARPAGRRVKGRGGEDDDRYAGKAGKFERLDDDDDETGAARSIEGWVVIAPGVAFIIFPDVDMSIYRTRKKYIYI